MHKRPGGIMVETSLPTRSQLIPVLSKWQEVTHKSHLGPMIVTIVFVLAMYTFASDTRPIPYLAEQGVFVSYFIILITVYLNLASFYFIYRLAGKEKSWLVFFGVALFTGFFMSTPVFRYALLFFHNVLAGGLPNAKQDFSIRLYKFTIAAGLFEELSKAVPLLLLFWYTTRMDRDQKQRYGIEEPLDGILLGAASAAGFAVVETLGQYVTQAIANRWIEYAAALSKLGALPRMSSSDAVTLMSQVIGCAPGVQLTIPRSLDQAFGHMAYSGYFGYFIGLAAMKPKRRWWILGVGLVSSAFVHGFWDASPGDVPTFLAAVSILSYGVLAAAILKAREVSPRSEILQPSIIFGTAGMPGAPLLLERGPLERRPPVSDLKMKDRPHEVAKARPVTAAVATEAGNVTVLKIGGRTVILVNGLRLLEHQIPGLKSLSGDQVVAEVIRHPQEVAVFGLKNLSHSIWHSRTAEGNSCEVRPGSTVRLTHGVSIDFGSVLSEAG
jgi:RsiW-degrading membrane proteinase PrsW (M82 family)